MNPETRGRVIDRLLDEVDKLQRENTSLRTRRALASALNAQTQSVQVQVENSRQLKKVPSAMRVAPSAAGPFVRRAKDYRLVHFGSCGLGKQLDSWNSLCKAMSANGKITELNFHDNALSSLGIGALQDLAAAIQDNSSTLTKLILSSNSLGDAELAALLPGIKQCCNLRELSLDYNDLSDVSCHALGESSCSWSLLTDLGFEGNPQMSLDGRAGLLKDIRDGKEI
jgi:Ran GTPase-activating protein (RanGAP) involved in mRNA processing and transport